MAQKGSFTMSDVSDDTVAPSADSSISRILADWVTDAIYIEGFGGSTSSSDNSPALSAAILAGKPVRFGPGTYYFNPSTPILTSSPTNQVTLLGVPGQTIIKGGENISGAYWFSVGNNDTPSDPSITIELYYGSGSVTFKAQGITFDASLNSNAQSGTATLIVTNGCNVSNFDNCIFTNSNTESATIGLYIQAIQVTGDFTNHVVTNCEASGNYQGFLAEAFDGFQITNCRAYSNTGPGIEFRYTGTEKPPYPTQGRFSILSGNRCWNNGGQGMLVGDFIQTLLDGEIVNGPNNPDTVYCIVANNMSYDNDSYGIQAQGQYMLVSGNTCYNNASGGIDANSSNSTFSGNVIYGSPFGIDAGGSVNITISDNNISNFSFCGVDVGGCQNSFVTGNNINVSVSGSSGILINVIEATSSTATTFPSPTKAIFITNNLIILSIENTSTFCCQLQDGAQGVALFGNNFIVPSGYERQCLLAFTNNYVVKNNFLNGNEATSIYFYDDDLLGYVEIIDTLLLSNSPISGMSPSNAITYEGKVTFINVLTQGSGYAADDPPTITITPAGGDAGSGAAAIARINPSGQIIGIQMTDKGSGYLSVPTVTISSGEFSDATAQAFIGLLNPPNGKHLKTINISNESIDFPLIATPLQLNYNNTNISCPIGATVEWFFSNPGINTGGGNTDPPVPNWSALSFPS
jgi:hypothetical protein